jgi:neutral ceramidase
VFTEIGLDLKEKSPFGDTFVMEQANGSQGYLPTPGQHKLGGYETWLTTNRVQLDASDVISHNLLEMLADLKKQ